MSRVRRNFCRPRSARMLTVMGLLLALGPASAHAAGPVSWGSPQTADPSHRLDGLACPSASFCVASDNNAQVLTSASPGSGAPWSQAAVPSDVVGVSCANPSFCAATDGTSVYTSTDPGGTPPTWIPATVDNSGSLVATSCPTTNFCAAVGGDTLYTSSNPSSRTNPVWTAQKTFANVVQTFSSISCPAAQFCVWTSYGSQIFTYFDGATTQFTLPGHLDLDSVSCASVSLCVAVAGGGEDVVSTDPTGGAFKWSVHTVETQTNGEGILVSVSCPSHLCVAVDGNGWAYEDADVLSQNVFSPNSPWTDGHVDLPGDYFGVVSCPPSSYVCYAGDTAGQVLQGTVAKEKLAVHRSGDGSGTMTGQQIHCPTTCSAGYPAGTEVTLKAHPAPGSVFNGWTGACSGKAACTITMSAPQTALATFVVPAPHGTKITDSKVHGTSATFSFIAHGKVSGFRCALQKGSGAVHFSKCSSPKTYRNLARGHYTFLVEGYNASGADPHPASKSFKIG